MPAKLKSDSWPAIAHVLFIDLLGYLRLPVNEQREVVQQLNSIVRTNPQFRKSEAGGKLIRIPVGDGMTLVFFQAPEDPVQLGSSDVRQPKTPRSTRSLSASAMAGLSATGNLRKIHPLGRGLWSKLRMTAMLSPTRNVFDSEPGCWR